jgi:hypothetical protein
VVEFNRDDRAQDTFEYILIIGVVTVAVIGFIVAAAPSMTTGVIDGVCSALDSLPSIAIAAGSCTP